MVTLEDSTKTRKLGAARVKMKDREQRGTLLCLSKG